MLEPGRSDPVFRIATRLAGTNVPLMVVAYAIISCGGTVALALLGGSAVAIPDNGTVELFEDYANLINFGVVLPLGVGLVASLYDRLRTGFEQLVRDAVIVFQSPEEGQIFLADIDVALNKAWFTWVALALSVIVNAVNFASLKDTWSAPSSGAAAYWFRLFVITNFFVVFQVLFKAIVAVRVMQQLFKRDITLQPLHPDGCGGLRSLGAISASINYFVCLLAVYLSVLGAVGRVSSSNPIFIPILVVFVPLAVYLFMIPLAKAHDKMLTEKVRVLSALNAEFQHTYKRVAASLGTDGLVAADADKLANLERLHQVASKMPVWPFDVKIIAQFIGAALVPVVTKLGAEAAKRFLGN